MRFLVFAMCIWFLAAAVPSVAGKTASEAAASRGLQGRILWCAAKVNFWSLDTQEKVAAFFDQCKKANINKVVMDVKTLTGDVLHRSSIAPRIKEVRGREYPADYDLLQVMVEEGKRVGIDVYATINVFAEGTTRAGYGPAFDRPEWQCIKYEAERWVRAPNGDAYPVANFNDKPLPGRLALYNNPKFLDAALEEDARWFSADVSGTITSAGIGKFPDGFAIAENGYVLLASGRAGNWLAENLGAGARARLEAKPRFLPVSKGWEEHYVVFANPSNPQVREYELSLIREIIATYDVAGIVFDRMRYPGIDSDFSDLSRQQFEQWYGSRVERFPEDIYTLDPLTGKKSANGKLFGAWMEWRALQIHDFLAEAREVVKQTNPNAQVAVYVGSWYDSYYELGVNWASPNYTPPYDWAGPSYRLTGYADMLDWITTGCYYGIPTREEARAANVNENLTVQAGGELSDEVVMNDTWVYGGLYLLQYSKKPEVFDAAMQQCAQTTQGVMLFDYVYVRDYGWWENLERMFPEPAQAPDRVPGLLDELRKGGR